MDKNNRRAHLTLRFQGQLSPEEIESLLVLNTDDVSIPHDFKAPQWNFERKVHNWHRYVGEDLAAMWDSFTLVQKAAIAIQFESAASAEHWD